MTYFEDATIIQPLQFIFIGPILVNDTLEVELCRRSNELYDFALNSTAMEVDVSMLSIELSAAFVYIFEVMCLSMEFFSEDSMLLRILS